MTETDTADGDVLTAREAAELLGISTATLVKYDLPSFRTPGGHRRYLRRDVVAVRDGLRPA